MHHKSNIMIEVQCQCGKKYKISEKDFISECPYCDSLGLLFSPKHQMFASEEVFDIFDKKVVNAIWMGLFDYQPPNLL